MRGRLRSSLVLAGLLMAAGCATRSHQDGLAGLTVKRFPAVVDVDLRWPSEPIPTAMLLRVPIKTYGAGGTALETLGGAHLDGPEQTMVAFLNSLRTSTLSKFRDLCYVPPSEPPPDFERMLALYRKLFDQFRNVRLEGRIPTERGDMFIWRVATSGGWRRRGSLVLAAGGKLGVVDVSSNYPLETFMLHCLDRMTAGDLDGLAAQPGERREFALDLDPRGAALEFDGQYLDVEAGDAGAGLPPPASVFRDATVKFRKGDRGGYLGLLTALSQKSQREWFDRMPPAVFETYRKIESRPRYIKFVLSADPIAIVFYAESAGDSWRNDSLGYRYVFRGTDGFKVANVSFQGFLDDVLRVSGTNLCKFLKRSVAR